MKKVLLFDFDGTIANSFTAVQEIFYELTDHPRVTDPQEIARLRRMSAIKVAKEMHISAWQIPRLIIRGRALMGKHMDDIPLFEGMKNTIKKLHDQGYELYIMSSNSAQNVEYFLATHNLRRYFKKIQGGVGLLDKAGALRKVMRQNRLDRETCVYIGDEVRDVDAAKKARVAVIAVGWGYNHPEVLAEHGPDQLANKPAEIVAALQKL